MPNADDITARLDALAAEVLATKRHIDKRMEELGAKLRSAEVDTASVLDADMAAQYLRRKVSTVRRLACMGRIPHYRVGRRIYCRREELDAWISNGGRMPEEPQPAA